MSWTASSVNEPPDGVDEGVRLTIFNHFEVNRTDGKACEENNPPFNVLPSLFDSDMSKYINPAMGEWRFVYSCSAEWQISHERILYLGPSNFAEEAVVQHLIYDNSSSYDPELLTNK